MAAASIYIISENMEFFPELGSGARNMADKVTAVIFGSEADASSVPCGADRALICPIADEQSPEDYASAIAEEIKKDDGAFVFIGNTILGRALAGKLGVLLDTAVYSNVSELSAEDGKLSFSQMVYGGTANRRISIDKNYGVITLNAGAFEVDPACGPASSCEMISGDASPSLNRTGRDEKHETSVNLAVAKRIVDIGRGLAKEEDLDIIREFAQSIGAELGCSRPVAENNKWLPKGQYMGITGVQVKPDIIISIGVSGQIQHIGGINKSKVIVAINKDKGALIFKNCDFGVVGDLYKIVPALTEKLK